MAQSRIINVPDWPAAMFAFNYWKKALDRDTADELVADSDQARGELESIVTVTPENVASWLEKYPTVTGWKRYQGAKRQRAYGREALTKVSLKTTTADRLRRLAKAQGLSLDDTVSRLLDSVMS